MPDLEGERDKTDQYVILNKLRFPISKRVKYRTIH